MFSAAKLFVAGAVVAAFGGYLIPDATDRSNGDIVPGAAMVGASCPEASALLEARESGLPADASIISRVQMEPFEDDTADEDSTTIDESDGYAQVTFSIDAIPVEGDDPRLDGLFSGEVTAHFFTEDNGYMSGSVRIENEAGSWSGEVNASDTNDGGRLYFQLVGDGAGQGSAQATPGPRAGAIVSVIASAVNVVL